ncbi:hypothetical protein CPAV1605_189 [seawater metagenome]|uniref:Uncharacterized protein n=1 Tax=seawater metagenome TaxID=1561972 RepID=A0A5E8CHD0_9ZZZZ
MYYNIYFVICLILLAGVNGSIPSQNLLARKIKDYTEGEKENYFKGEYLAFQGESYKFLSEKKNKIYPNQENVALTLVQNFVDRKIVFQMCIGQTMSGKTGTMNSFIKQYISESKMNSDFIIDTSNIYIITGLSSKAWMKQTKDSFPPKIKDNVIHRDQLKVMKDKIENKENLLIIIDEVQYGSQHKQTISKMLHDMGLTNYDGFTDVNKMFEKNIKVVQFTATPDGLINDLLKKMNKDNYKIEIIKPGQGYVSSMKLFEDEQVIQFNNLADEGEFKNNISKVEKLIDNFKENKYFIFREDNKSKIEENLKQKFPQKNYDYQYYNQDTDIEINNILKKKPKRHTFILIKDKMRCSERLELDNVGILYERKPKEKRNISDSVMIQGLLGRATGYHNNTNMYVFTNIPSIIKYYNLWQSKFTDQTLIDNWNCNTKNKATINFTQENKNLTQEDKNITQENKNKVKYIFKEQAFSKIDNIDEALKKYGGNKTNMGKLINYLKKFTDIEQKRFMSGLLSLVKLREKLLNNKLIKRKKDLDVLKIVKRCAKKEWKFNNKHAKYSDFIVNETVKLNNNLKGKSGGEKLTIPCKKKKGDKWSWLMIFVEQEEEEVIIDSETDEVIIDSDSDEEITYSDSDEENHYNNVLYQN